MTLFVSFSCNEDYHFASKQVPCDKNCALDDNIIAKKETKKRQWGLNNEHRCKLKLVIKHFDMKILGNFKFRLAVVKRKDNEWVLILIIPRYDNIHRKGTRKINIKKYEDLCSFGICCFLTIQAGKM